MPELKPYDLYVPMFAGRVMKYRMGVGALKEDVDPDIIRGAMCMTIDDFEALELYIEKLRRGYK